MTVEELVAMADRAARFWPGAQVVKNQVGNLTVLVDGEMVGWLNLGTGEVNV